MSEPLETAACEPAEGSIACGWAFGNGEAAVLVRRRLDVPQPAMAIAINTALEIAAAVEALIVPSSAAGANSCATKIPRPRAAGAIAAGVFALA
jgi:hypothetical protein